MSTLKIQQTDKDCYFTVKVVPCSSRTVLAGVLGGMLKLRVTAIPEKGRANQSIIKFLAKKLNVNKQAVTITAGLGNPIKQVCVSGVSVDEVLGRLNI